VQKGRTNVSRALGTLRLNGLNIVVAKAGTHPGTAVPVLGGLHCHTTR